MSVCIAFQENPTHSAFKHVYWFLPLCVDNPGCPEHYEHSSLQRRAAVKKWKTFSGCVLKVCLLTYELLLHIGTHRVVAVVTNVISTNKNGDHLPIGFKIDSLHKKDVCSDVKMENLLS